MPDTQLPLPVTLGMASFTASADAYSAGKPLDALRLVNDAQAGLAELTRRATALAEAQGATAAEIGKALNISRQAAHARLSAAPPLKPLLTWDGLPAEEIYSGELNVQYGVTPGIKQRYPLNVYRLADGELIAMVHDVWENTSLMNGSERIMRAVQDQWPGARVLERWLPSSGVGTMGRDAKYAWSSGTGGFYDADLDDLATRGLDLR